MINLNSNQFKSFSVALNQAFENENENFNDWDKAINKTVYSDGFLAFLEHPNSQSLLNHYGFDNLNKWILNADTWSAQYFDPRNDNDSKAMILYALWSHFKNSVTDLLKQSRLRSNLPTSGGILVYTAGLSKCLVLKYNIDSEFPKLELIDIINNPQSAFDFWGTILKAELREKNSLKEILSTGHKIIIHRGVIIHVDRRKDLQVFGPSIDTLLVNEILSQEIYENEIVIEKALEIGCGNGLITVSLAKSCKNLNEIYSLDINFNAIYCVHKNINANINPFILSKKKVYLTNGEYGTSLFNTKYNLIVCNPPYIPLEDSKKDINKKIDYFQAVGGLELVDEILSSLNEVLAHDGKLLLLVSNLSLDYTISKIPEQFKYTLPLPNGHRVLFDVEAVLNDPNWLKFLTEKCGLIIEKDNFFHDIYPIWISRKQLDNE